MKPKYPPAPPPIKFDHPFVDSRHHRVTRLSKCGRVRIETWEFDAPVSREYRIFIDGKRVGDADRLADAREGAAYLLAELDNG